MLMFSLTANSQSEDGFKLSVRAESDKEIEIAKELSNLLISKIEKISVEIKNYE